MSEFVIGSVADEFPRPRRVHEKAGTAWNVPAQSAAATKHGPCVHDEITSLCHHAGIVPRFGAQGRTVQTILTLVPAGFGATVMTDSYRVLHREGSYTSTTRRYGHHLHLVWRAEDMDPLLTRFLTVLNAVKARYRDDRLEAPAGSTGRS